MALLQAIALFGAAGYLGIRTWGRLRFRCARWPAKAWFVGLNAAFVVAASLTYLYADPLAAGAAMGSILVANLLDGHSVRLLGGPDPTCLLQRFRSISGKLLPEVRNDESIASARAWARDLRVVRTEQTRRAIDAINAAIEAKYGPTPADVMTSNAAWTEYRDAVVELLARTDARDANRRPHDFDE